jgi:hypothetical protein
MKPSPMQHIFAKDWPTKAYLSLLGIISIVVSIFAFGRGSFPAISVLSDWHFLLLILLCSPLVFFGLLRATSFVLNPVYDLGAKLNGAPFHVGDSVRILVGPYRGRVVRIYSVWHERRQICVDLGEQAKNDSTDTFLFTKVCRESAV